MADSADVVLSIDRFIPSVVGAPKVLMSNTLSYYDEATAILAGGWSQVIAPTRFFARRIQQVAQGIRVSVVHYGLPPTLTARISNLPPPTWESDEQIIRLPHRPDSRKGHLAAIEGLARAGSIANNMKLEISWLKEPRYSAYRKELEDRAAYLGVASRVDFTDWLDGDDRWNALTRSCGVLQLGTFEESFGLSVVESLLAGRPAFTRTQPAIREVVGDSPLLREIRDPFEWYSHFKSLSGELSRGSNGSSRRSVTELLSYESMVEGYDRVLRAVLGA
ncbi:glycosyltransferase [Pseudofrankia sp. DC12]|uniref:glycosyltransferase n=1 Tax=Pseudofrankia sp. DC12 TaxID=683315 RepID=UPI0012FBC6A9|nr:glycosyltransferase [Pseudofrankia sp. DC12]